MSQPCIIQKQHKGGEIEDYHEPVWLGWSEQLDTLGRSNNNGWTRWAVVVCNNPGCEFRALVNAEVVVAAATMEETP